MASPIPFFSHDLGEAELRSVEEVLATPLLTTGPRVEAFESRFASLLGAANCVALSSCTGAMHLALEGLGVGPGDEVIVPGLTFAATALAVLQAGATPVLVDVDPADGLLDLELIESAVTSRTRAVIPVHLYGQMVDMRSLAEIAARLGLRIVEDAAHCIEGVRDGVRPGQLSDAACFSFYATKNMTCGEGGALATNSDSLANHVRLARSHGMDRVAADRMREGYQPWDIKRTGWKYNMDDIQAALLLPQFDRLGSNLRRRRSLAARYDEFFDGVTSVRTPIRQGESHALHLYTIQLEPTLRLECMQALRAAEIGFTVNYAPMASITAFRSMRQVPNALPVSDWIGTRTLSLPLYPRLTLAEVDRVAETVLGVIR